MIGRHKKIKQFQDDKESAMQDNDQSVKQNKVILYEMKTDCEIYKEKISQFIINRNNIFMLI
jgi:hypothetical protein